MDPSPPSQEVRFDDTPNEYQQRYKMVQDDYGPDVEEIDTSTFHFVPNKRGRSDEHQSFFRMPSTKYPIDPFSTFSHGTFKSKVKHIPIQSRSDRIYTPLFEEDVVREEPYSYNTSDILRVRTPSQKIPKELSQYIWDPELTLSGRYSGSPSNLRLPTQNTTQNTTQFTGPQFTPYSKIRREGGWPVSQTQSTTYSDNKELWRLADAMLARGFSDNHANRILQVTENGMKKMRSAKRKANIQYGTSHYYRKRVPYKRIKQRGRNINSQSHISVEMAKKIKNLHKELLERDYLLAKKAHGKEKRKYQQLIAEDRKQCYIDNKVYQEPGRGYVKKWIPNYLPLTPIMKKKTKHHKYFGSQGSYYTQTQ